MKIIPMMLMLAFATQISAGGSSCGISGPTDGDSANIVGAEGGGTWRAGSSS
jgi:hypothetical protein